MTNRYYSFKKLYADVVTADGTACILYLAWLNLLGYSTSYAGVELFTSDGERMLKKGISSKSAEDFISPVSPLKISMEFPDGQLNATYDFPMHNESIHGFNITPHLYWKALVPVAEVEMQLIDSRHSLELKGQGYLDWVEISHITRYLGISRIQWGRIHNGETTIVFNHIRLEKNINRNILLYSNNGQVLRSIDNSFIINKKGQQQVLINFKDDKQSQHLILYPKRQLYRGAVFDKKRIPGIIERKVIKWLSGPMHQTRWLSRVSDDKSGETGWAMHEEVNAG